MLDTVELPVSYFVHISECHSLEDEALEASNMNSAFTQKTVSLLPLSRTKIPYVFPATAILQAQLMQLGQ